MDATLRHGPACAWEWLGTKADHSAGEVSGALEKDEHPSTLR